MGRMVSSFSPIVAQKKKGPRPKPGPAHKCASWVAASAGVVAGEDDHEQHQRHDAYRAQEALGAGHRAVPVADRFAREPVPAVVVHGLASSTATYGAGVLAASITEESTSTTNAPESALTSIAASTVHEAAVSWRVFTSGPSKVVACVFMSFSLLSVGCAARSPRAAHLLLPASRRPP